MNESAKPKSFRSAVAADARDLTLGRAVALITVLLAVFFEWGAGNETVLVTSMATTYDRLPSWGGVAAVGGVGFLVAGVIQLIAGTVAAVGYPSLENTTKAARRIVLRLNPGLDGKNWWTISWRARFLLAFAVGASAVVLVQQTTTGKVGFQAHRGVVLQSAVLTALGAAMVGMLLTGAAQIGRSFPSAEPTVDRIMDVASNPLVWFGLFSAIGIYGWISSKPSEDAHPEAESVDA